MNEPDIYIRSYSVLLGVAEDWARFVSYVNLIKTIVSSLGKYINRGHHIFLTSDASS